MSATCPTTEPSFRSRIGGDARSGYFAAPRRYRLYLSPSCPDCLRIAVTHSLLGLADTLPVTLLPAVPDTPDGGHLALRPLYEASAHQYAGPAAAPALSDGWTGRIVSTDTPGILRDLARQFGGHGPDLYPRGAEDAVAAFGHRCDEHIAAAAQRAGQVDADAPARAAALEVLLRELHALDELLAAQPYVLGGELTLADVQLWAELVQLDTVHRRHLDARAVHRITGHPHLWAYARRLAAHPAFGPHLDLDGIARRHEAHCRGAEGAGAAMPIVDWAAYARGRAEIHGARG